MTRATSHRKRPRDPAQLAKLMIVIASGEIEDRAAEPSIEGKNPAAVSLGRRGGLKGGKARSEKLTPERRAETAWKVSLLATTERRARLGRERRIAATGQRLTVRAIGSPVKSGTASSKAAWAASIGCCSRSSGRQPWFRHRAKPLKNHGVVEEQSHFGPALCASQGSG
jgi:hypothetical protein